MTTPGTTPSIAHGWFSDARMADQVAKDVYADKFIFVRGLGWHEWTGTRWEDCGDGHRPQALRAFVVSRIMYWGKKIGTDPRADGMLENWKKLASANRITSVMKLARNKAAVAVKISQLDADRDLLNTPGGVVNLVTGAVAAHDPKQLMTKITRGSYRAGYTHPDVDALCAALPAGADDWYWAYMGKAITGHHHDVNLIQVGGGNNGKGALTNAGIRTALGDYAILASPALFAAGRATGHATSVTDLRGTRLALGEELNEGTSLDITAIKRFTDVEVLRARKLYQDNVEFPTTHSLVLNGNYRPQVTEVDWGTWRRLALLVFPYTFVDKPADMTKPHHRLGDPRLKDRVEAGIDGQHDALVTLMVEGAMRWYADPLVLKVLPDPIAKATKAWRGDTDRIFGYWDECLEPDPTCAVMTTTLKDDFNKWLEANGHHPWSTELFAERFGSHAATAEHGVDTIRSVSVPKLSYPPSRLLTGYGAVPRPPGVHTGRLRVWRGVKFIDGTFSYKGP